MIEDDQKGDIRMDIVYNGSIPNLILMGRPADTFYYYKPFINQLLTQTEQFNDLFLKFTFFIYFINRLIGIDFERILTRNELI